jgi:hypothetical protein
MAIITTDKLVTRARLKCGLTGGQAGITDAAILEIASEELVQNLFSEIAQQGEDFHIYQEEIELEADESVYRIPDRAFLARVRHVVWTDDTQFVTLDKLDYEDLDRLGVNTASQPTGVIMDGYNLRLVPTINSAPTGKLIVYYTFRPNDLCVASDARTISSVNGNTMTLNSVPSSFVVGATLDIINHRSGNEIVGYDLEITVVNGNDITVAALPADAAARNHVALSGQSPVPMIPEDLHPLLQEMVILRILQARKDSDGVAMAASRVKAIRDRIPALLKDRISSKPDFIIGRAWGIGR